MKIKVWDEETDISSLENEREWNLDQLPKFIYSDSYVTDQLINIKIDQYVNFRSLRGMQFMGEEKILNLPLSRTKILSTGDLTNWEKKTFF